MAVVRAEITTLDSALSRLHLEGAIFFRSEFTGAWSYESLTSEVAEVLRPGAERLIIFHIIATGSCWISIGEGDRYWANAGDVVVLPYGDQHRVGGPDPGPCVSIAELIEPPPWERLPVVRYGTTGPRTDIVCGYLYSEDHLFDPRIRALPSVFVVRPTEGPAARWVASSVEYALAASGDAPPAADDTRLPELLLTEVLRQHLGAAPTVEGGWIAALRDPVVGSALAALHEHPERHWTVNDLASTASISRSVLDQRFRLLVGRSPISYLTAWRMHVADDLLASTELTMSQIAPRVGYASEEAFSRAYKRERGVTPSSRRRRTEPPGDPNASRRPAVPG